MKDLGPFYHTISPNYAIPAHAIGGQCSNPPEESCSDAGCPVHGDELSPMPDYEPDGTERPGIPRRVAGPPLDLGDDPDGDNS